MSDQNTNPAEQLDENGIEDPTNVDPEGQQEGEVGDQEDAPPADDSQGAEERQKKSRTERIAARYEQKFADQAREMEYWKNAALSGGKQAVVEEPKGDPEPVLADFDGQGLDAYLKAHSTWTRKQVLSEAREDAKRELEFQRLNSTLQSRVAEAKTRLKDWDEVIGDSEVAALAETQNFLIESEVGPDIAYHLAKHPEEHERLNKLNPMRRIAELGKLEDKLSAKAPVAAAKKATSAPEKLSSVKGNAVIRTDRAAAAKTGDYATWKAAKAASK